MSTPSLYKITFLNQGNLYEVFARKVYQADLYGFVTIEELVFDERNSVVVDPSEERLKGEFEGVKRSYVPMHAIVRIDEVEQQGKSKITEIDSKVMPFPSSIYTPNGSPGKTE